MDANSWWEEFFFQSIPLKMFSEHSTGTKDCSAGADMMGRLQGRTISACLLYNADLDMQNTKASWRRVFKAFAL